MAQAQSNHPVRACPTCGKPSITALKPFCSRRCADVDLGRWLGGHYVISESMPDEFQPAFSLDRDE